MVPGSIAGRLGRRRVLRRLRIAQHVVEPVHVRVELLDHRAELDEVGERPHEADEQRLVGHQHADGQLAVHDPEPAEEQHGGGRERLRQRRHGGRPLRQHVQLLFGVHRARVVAGVAGEELVLGAGGLQRLDHLQPAHRGPHQLALVLHQPAADVDARARRPARCAPTLRLAIAITASVIGTSYRSISPA